MKSIRDQAAHFPELVGHYAQSQPDRIALRHIHHEDQAPLLTTYAQLDLQARSIAGVLQHHLGHLQACGQRCVLMLPTGADYAAAFLGCLHAGVIAVPAFAPEYNRQTHLDRLTGILQDAAPGVVLGRREDLDKFQHLLQPFMPAGGRFVAIEDVHGWEGSFQPSLIDTSSLAFLQYTSGSTSAPKGVMVSHANLMANEVAMARHFVTDASTESWVSWLPLYHDMGLMCGLLLPLYYGGTLNLMSPNYFLGRPARWLETMSEYNGTFSGGPDFAYRLCVERIKPSAVKHLKLDNWSLAFSGSEPIRIATLDAFSEHFAPAGFDRRALTPSYGLAEATLFVSAAHRSVPFGIKRFDGSQLAAGDADQAVFANQNATSRLPGCGWCRDDHDLRIVDPADQRVLPSGQVGEVWIAGPSVAQGYWQNADATAQTFVEHDGKRWLRSGDLGIASGGELFITGRLKDLIILNGQNLYPQDIEQSLEKSVELLRRGRIAAFPVTDEQGAEGVGLALEISRNVRRLMKPQIICDAVRDAVSELFLVAPKVIVLLEPGALPRTTSGKLQRSACRAGWQNGSLDSFATWQDGRLLNNQTEERAADVSPLLPEVVAAWAEVLGKQDLAAHDHFFARGGDSVGVVQVLSRLNNELGLTLEPAHLFEHPTLEAFNAHVARQSRSIQAPKSVTRISRETPAEQSFAQQRLWFLAQLEPDSSAYHLCGQLSLSGAIDDVALQRSFDDLAARHESLRTTFAIDPDDTLVQRIHAEQPVVLEPHDLSLHAQPLEALAALAKAAVEQPMDLQTGPLWRVLKVRLSPSHQQLVLVLHHIIADGWSVQVLLKDFMAFYSAHAQNRTPALAPLPIQYADFAAWQRERLAGGEGERQLGYWRQQLGDTQPVLSLPADRPRPAQQSHRGARYALAFDRTLSQGLRDLATRHGATLFMVMLAAYKTLLLRYSSQTDLRVGVPVAGRTCTEAEGLIGLFVNTLVLRTEVSPQQSFSTLIESVKRTALGAQNHQDLPFEQLVEALGVSRNLSHNPLCQVKFTQQFPLPQNVETGGMRLDVNQLDDYAAHFDLGLDITDSADGIQAVFTYACDLFDEARIAGLAADLLRICAQGVAQPETRLNALQLAAVPSRLDAETVAFPATDVLSLWDVSVHAQPERLALQGEGHGLDFAAVDAQANRLAAYLHQAGVGAESRVGVALERSVEFVVSLLAVLKAGAAYVPLDPKWPAERQAFVLADSGARWLISDAVAPADYRGEVVPMDADAAWRSRSETPRNVRPHPEQAAYLIYTSGTSGTPKGVVISHGALADYVQGLLKRLELAPDASMAMVSTVGADLGHTVLFGALCSARTLHLISPDRTNDADRFAAYMAQHRVGALKIVPTHLSGLLQATHAADVLPEHALILGGDALPWDLVAQVKRLKPGCRVINHYGPTETTVGVLTHEPTHAQAASETAPIGRPLPNAVALILNEYLEPVVQGDIGDLYIGGPGLARGYHDRPGMTAAVFIPDPCGQGRRLYRSGDRARLLANGRIEFLGRADDQVKVRGYRVALGEIAQRLRQLDGLRDAHVRVDERGQLIAYGLTEKGHQPDGEALRGQLAECLPDYMVPSHVLTLDAFPLTANGKLDHSALPAPQVVSLTFETPHEGVEATLAALWETALSVEAVGRHDNFFTLGGDSILSLQIIARARRQGIRLTPKQLFEKQTIAELAQVAVLSEAKPVAAPVVAAVVPRDFALTPIQARFFALPMAQRSHWNQSLLLNLPRALDVVVFQEALSVLLARHDSLRLSFHQGDDGQWQQRYRDSENAERVLWTCELTREEDLASLSDEAQRSLNIETGPLMRVVHARLPSGEGRLLLAIHHLVVDGVSWRVLLEDLHQAYRCLAAGQRVTLAEKTASFQSWSQSLHTLARRPELAAQLPHWQALQAADACLPGDTSIQSHVGDGETIGLTLDEHDTRRLLSDAPAAYRTRIDDLLLAALSLALHQWTGRRRHVISLEGHGREDASGALDLSRSVGWFTSLYPLALEAGDDAIATLKAVKEAVRAVPEKGLGYGMLKHLAGAELPELVGQGLTFNYLGRFDDRFDESGDALFSLSSQTLSNLRDPQGPLANALAVDGQVRGGRLQLDWTFSRKRFTRDSIEQLVALYRKHLLQLIDHCSDDCNAGLTPSDFPLAGLNQTHLDALAIPAREIEDILPLAPMQQGILLHSLLEQGNGIYLMQDQYAVGSDVDFEAFKFAWQQVVQRHPALRTAFHGLESGVQRQVVMRRVPSPAQLIDLSHLAREAAEAELEALLSAEREQGFDFSRAPLLRLRLIKFGEADFRIVQSHHHALIDAWCRGLMLTEFFAHYRAFLDRRHISLPAARPYRDFLAWLSEQDEAVSRDYWRNALAGFTDVTPLPYRRSPQGEPQMRDVTLALGAEQTAKLADQARQHRLTANTFVQAAWALLLMHHADRDEVLFGVTVAGRPTELEGIEGALGLFINTLPLRLKRPGAGAPALALLNALQAQNAEMRQHEHLSLADIQLLADTPRGQPLFDSLFVFENVPLGAEVQQAVNEYRINPLANRTHTNYPLTVVLLPGESLQLQLTYDTRHFDDVDMHSLVGHFRRLLTQLIDNPQQTLSQLQVLERAEREQLLAQGQGPVQPHWYDISYLERFESRVQAHPHLEVARCQGERLSYSELNRAANRIGHGLIDTGVQGDDVVALFAPRGLPLLSMIIGAFKAGGAYLALDDRHPAGRSARMLGSSAAPVLLTPRDCLPQVEAILALTEVRPRLLVLEDLLASGAEDNPGRYASAEQLAYVIYTSGSTGEPKGVMVNQRGMLNNQMSKLPYLRLGEGDVIAQTAATGFDISVWQFLTAPLFGGRVEILPDAVVHDPQRLLEEVVANQVSVLECVPAVIDGMLAVPPHKLDALRWLLPTGEALTVDLATRWFARYPDVPLVNAYGPAECADDVALHTLTAAPAAKANMPIGRPTDNNRLYVLDSSLQLTAPGVVGELYIGGVGVGRGYAARPALTAERFLPDPFGEAGARLYRSGDLARWNAEGALEYVGRADFQVKIRGQRIELGEIENVLLAQPSVHEAVVSAQPTPHGPQLVAYVVAEAQQALSADVLKTALAQALPAFMVPAHVMQLERLPRNANGKLDRKALPAPDWQARAFEAPQGEREEILAELWQSLLKVERVGRDDNFFELGGHSLLATRLLSRIRERLGVSIPLAQAFEATTVAAQAALIDTLQGQTLTLEGLDALDALMNELEESN
ncbi:non-ribosomal peptide synthase domain TIGR01720/amino acid adenylation domain-containing protein [Pseudomonas sp. NFACC02]|uniref:non-ribosomal peptide synthetase n=1 Tax=Pseudomonas sp. NFACC02 TaxID=1566250 RepID=UPI0008B3491A|nr:non-ribosomal peptide synthetase [Pseudomonas sp. NFACC02]SEP81454.1 non-ribosomal peptide synthase domain TIGR01720/amino acid adenylation domain-containing protein [Pseudomonas sp. NFACC02]